MENHRLKLREIIEEDYPHLIDISFYDGLPAQSIQDAKRMNEKIILDVKAGDSFHWVICDVNSDEVFGTCGFYRGFDNETGEIGYVLKPGARGKGIMGEAVGLMLDFGWKILKLKSIIAYTAADNQSSINLLKKHHFSFEKKENDEFRFSIKNPY